MPSNLNFRANIYGLKNLGVEYILSFSAVGSLQEHLEPIHFVIPDQFFDRTRGRASTFFDEDVVAHVTFADPVCPLLSGVAEDACKAAGVTVHRGGTYCCMEGPAFSTKAESNLYRSWGFDVIGMTNLQEAKLAREAEMSYATIAMVTDYDCWHPQHDAVTVETVIEYLTKNSENAQRVAVEAVKRIPRRAEPLRFGLASCDPDRPRENFRCGEAEVRLADRQVFLSLSNPKAMSLLVVGSVAYDGIETPARQGGPHARRRRNLHRAGCRPFLAGAAGRHRRQRLRPGRQGRAARSRSRSRGPRKGRGQNFFLERRLPPTT